VGCGRKGRPMLCALHSSLSVCLSVGLFVCSPIDGCLSAWPGGCLHLPAYGWFLACSRPLLLSVCLPLVSQAQHTQYIHTHMLTHAHAYFHACGWLWLPACLPACLPASAVPQSLRRPSLPPRPHDSHHMGAEVFFHSRRALLICPGHTFTASGVRA